MGIETQQEQPNKNVEVPQNTQPYQDGEKVGLQPDEYPGTKVYENSPNPGQSGTKVEAPQTPQDQKI